MNRISERFIKLIIAFVFLTIFACSVKYVSFILQDKNCIYKNSDFFKEENQFDVLFFGSSHMEIFVSPMELWDEYGITSYNFGAPEEGLPVTYWVMANAFKKNTPKVAVVDMHMFNLEGNYSNDEHIHYGLDSFPLNLTKLNAIKDLSEGINSMLEKIFTIGKYHGEWKNISESSFRNTEFFAKGNASYGYLHTMKVTPYEQYPLVNDISEILSDSIYYNYLEKMIELCKEYGVKLVFVSTPYYCSDHKQANIHAAEQYAKERNIPYINFVDMDSVIDMSVDMYDEGHVNQSGMQKVTSYLGSYLVDNFELISHVNEADYESWDQDYNKYFKKKISAISEVSDIYATLEMLHDDDIISTVFVGKDVKHTDELFFNLMQNIARPNLKHNAIINEKSSDIITLDNLMSSLNNKDYLVTVNDEVNEVVGSDALKRINSVDDSISFISEDIVIVVSDKKTEDIQLIKKYNQSFEQCEVIPQSICEKERR